MYIRIGNLCFFWILLSVLALVTADVAAQDSKRFREAHAASRSAGQPLAAFLQGWIAQAPQAELEALGVASKGWTAFGQEPPLFKAFVFDSAFESELDAVLEPLTTLLQRAPALRSQAPWQSLLARAQLAARQPQAALISAQRAWALDRRLCAADCPWLVRSWLQTGKAPAPSQWPAIPTPPVYNLAKVDCEAQPESLQPVRSAWAIPPQELVAGALGEQAYIAWLLREQWGMQLAGCSPRGQLALERAIDKNYPAMVVQQSWRMLEDSVSSGPGRSLRFLGQTLPLPAQECDFAVAPSCLNAFKPLSVTSARVLAEDLRSLSEHLWSPGSPGQCPAPEKEGGPSYAQVQKAFRAQFRSIENASSKDALPALRAILNDPQWQILWRSEMPYEVSQQLGRIARDDASFAVQALQFASSWIDGGTLELRQSASAADLLSLLLLRNRRPPEALAQLNLAQLDFPQQNRTRRITQLRAVLAGADLDASLPRAQIPRPWLIGGSKGDSAMSALLPRELSTSLDGVQLLDIIYAMGGEQAVARRQLQVLWLPWLLGWGDDSAQLRMVLLKTYGPEGLRSQFDQALSDLQTAPKSELRFDGIVLPLPDQYCADRSCSAVLPVDQQWIRARLRTLVEDKTYER